MARLTGAPAVHRSGNPSTTPPEIARAISLSVATGQRGETVYMRQAFAYGGAAAMTPYLLIKVSWVVAGMIGVAEGGLGFVVLNAVTVGMSAAGIALALALARPWGMRLPARPVLVFAWIAGGFLVPMIPYMVISSLLPATGEPSSAPGWEQWLIE